MHLDVEVGPGEVSDHDLTSLASGSLGRRPADDEPERLPRRGAGEECIIRARSELRCNEPAPNVWVIGIALVRIDSHRADNLITCGGQMGAGTHP